MGGTKNEVITLANPDNTSPLAAIATSFRPHSLSQNVVFITIQPAFIGTVYSSHKPQGIPSML